MSNKTEITLTPTQRQILTILNDEIRSLPKSGLQHLTPQIVFDFGLHIICLMKMNPKFAKIVDISQNEIFVDVTLTEEEK